MTSPEDRGPEEQAGREPGQGPEDKPFQFTDKRKVDPETAQPRPSGEAAAGSAGDDAETDPLAGLDFEPSDEAEVDAAVLAAKAEAAEHLDALQRERASFTNYRNRSLRDQEAARTKGIEDVLTALLPVLDDIDRARQHGELTGPFAAISDKLDASLEKFGIERYGAVGDEFDPTVHEALMHQPDPEATVTTVNLVIEPGYRIGDRVVRAARVSVVGPQ
ncbi:MULTISPECIES: nucleotide exchange factor GrpE [Cellulosimicrobium]|uniref:Protein GrpE n=1 Tax=Cellulosimicrobium funkei TaxID=264251 RepID=A0A0H2KHP8_9MICO|nr:MULTISPECIES: nucleotide exchange factor GrpE [Cellulosimicrobium]KLN33160.1 molecular chaperone GrpE [Cellulosimicrobium funkei]KZM78633.1 nucleotide exchange factor GrpE [Cellulosimicrobium sp. I38E]